MEVFVAKQPIFNRNEEVIAYELLYRGSKENYFPDIDGDQATVEVIINSFLNIGMNELSDGKKCYVNFTKKLLETKVPTYFNPSSIVVEILEDVEIDESLVRLCRELKQLGYTIALDDFKIQEKYALLPALIQYIDIIKVDFLHTTKAAQMQIIKKYKPHDIKLLAEKVETREEFLFAYKIGYSYFQGYFFSKPEVISSYDVPVYMNTYYQLLNEIAKPEPNIDIIAMNIEQDLSLSYKLLKLINSPALRPRNKITSIKQAIVLLGLNEIKKWIYVLSIQPDKQGSSKMKEVVRISLMRAKICELIASYLGEQLTSSYMLTGMLSLMDTLLHRRLEDIVKDLPLSDEIQEALLYRENNLGQVLKWSIQIEKGNTSIEGLNISDEKLFTFYKEASKWATSIMEIQENS
ncbi:EAL and HDOD domain-containing protein [Metabacillus malikii]|uniref:EAL and modified HD-GYP domain-containing signal transduction protein n=1 Tax=Metabacillus malikii TaxID=1504265 RepID=A0ABT9ZBX6_9BACI|nr:HDOD domain-containing protein [Metabacillus malikii]MDQ0229768.1 EAL and modified HD-GYP domain-containing signal transduction protein [Metabacillus malikii]